MKKNFFKKLSLGLALALVVGTTAQAGTAKAAETWPLKQASKTLYLNKEQTHDFDFKKLPKGWKDEYNFKWTTADSTIAVVAKGGKVTPVSVGETTVNCEVTEKDGGKVVATASSKVVVKANAAEVKISNADDFDGMVFPVGQVIDLNRTMYDENGNATTKRGKYVTDYTRWYAWDGSNYVSEEAIAIDPKTGTFTLNAEGTYELWCETYQSSTNDTWTAYDYITVTVKDEAQEIVVKQKSVNTFIFEFTNPIYSAEFNERDFIDNHLNVICDKAGNDQNVLPVKSAVATTTNGVVDYITVTMWDNFVDGETYTVEYKADEVNSEDIIDEETFKASVGKVEKIEVAIINPLNSQKAAGVDNVVYVTDAVVPNQKFALTFLDDEEIDVTDLYLAYNKTSELYTLLPNNGQLVVEAVGAQEDMWLVYVDGNTFKINAYEGAYGKTFTLKATYSEYNTTTGTLDEVAYGQKVFSVEKVPALKAEAKAISVRSQGNNCPTHDDALKGTNVKVVAANDNGLWVAVAATNDLGTKIGNADGSLRFYSADPQIAMVDETTGYLTPCKEGYARINVYYVNPNAAQDTPAQYVDSLLVNVRPAREATSLVIKGNVSLKTMTANVTISNEAGNYATSDIKESVEFVLQIFDTYGDAVTTDGLISVVEGAEYLKNGVGAYDSNKGGFPVVIENDDADVKAFITNADNKGLYAVNVNAVFALTNEKGGKQQITVTLKKPADLNIVRYDVTVTDVTLNNANSGKAADVRVYGLNSGGLKVANITNFEYLNTDVSAYVSKLNKGEVASPVTGLVYTITKNGKVVDANGSFTATAVTGAVITSKTGEVLDVSKTASGSAISVVKTYTADNMNVTYTTNAGSYTITLCEIYTLNGNYVYKTLDSDVLTVTNDQTQLKVEVEKIVTETKGLTLRNDFAKKLVWTYDDDVCDAVLECLKLTVGNEDAETYSNIAFQVRINGNKMFIKSVKVFKSVDAAKNEFVALEKDVNLTITIGK